MDDIVCPVDVTHTLIPTIREQPPNFGDVNWYDCNECGLSFAVGFEWPESKDHPKIDSQED